LILLVPFFIFLPFLCLFSLFAFLKNKSGFQRVYSLVKPNSFPVE
jgi:hypothetical protein